MKKEEFDKLEKCNDSRACVFKVSKSDVDDESEKIENGGGEEERCKILTSTYPDNRCPFCKDELVKTEHTVQQKPKKKEVTTDEIESIVNSILENAMVPMKDQDDSCSFYTKGGCKATSHKTCLRCRFYKPTLLHKMTITAECILEIVKQKKALGILQDKTQKRLVETKRKLAETREKLELSDNEILKAEIINSTHYSE